MPEETLPPVEENKFDPTILVVAALAAIIAIRSPAFFKGSVIFVLTLGILVFVHEWGHYQFARWAGMKVNRFALGFPPWIYTKRRNGIDYSIGALPIGGMVDIAGLGSEEEMVATAKPAIPEVPQGPSAAPRYEVRRDRPFGERQFQDCSLGWRFLTLFAGPMMNFIFALVVFIGVYSFIGAPNKFEKTNSIEMVEPGMPAFKAGLQYGDKIVGVNDFRSKDVDKLIKAIGDLNGKAGTLLVERDGKQITKYLQPVIEEIETPDGKGFKKASRIGIMFLTVVTGYEKMSPVKAIETGVDTAFAGIRGILDMLTRAMTRQLTSSEVRSIGGPVKIGQSVTMMAKRGWIDVIITAGALSLNLGLLNLFPLPALDGGRIMFLGYELVARKPVDPNKESLVHVVGMVMLLTFMLLITMRDVWPFLQRGLHGLAG